MSENNEKKTDLKKIDSDYIIANGVFDYVPFQILRKLQLIKNERLRGALEKSFVWKNGLFSKTSYLTYLDQMLIELRVK